MLVVLGITQLFAVWPAQSGEPACLPSGDLNFLCSAIKPEDLKAIPATNFIVASGFSPGSGLKLIDIRVKRLVRWYEGRPEQVSLDAARYPDCTTPPDPALFNARGLSLRRTGRGSATLHVVNHGGREAIEAFEITTNGSNMPQLRWKGCLRLPTGYTGNAVATYADGTVLVTILTRPGTSITDFEQGRNTGAVFERGLADTEFRLIAGTALPGNNGIETMRNGKGFFVVAFGRRAIAIFRRGATAGPEAIVPAPGFMPDNVHWNGKRLIAAGMVSDEPACGGQRLIINGAADTMLCPRGWKVAAFDPAKRQFRLVASGARNMLFNGVSQALIIGNCLWLGSYQADRIAYRPLRDNIVKRKDDECGS